MSRIFLLLMLHHCASAVSHSLKYFFTSSSGVPNFPEFVIVGLVDEVRMFHYDSVTRRAEPKQDWMIKVTAADPQYWERQTQNAETHQEVFKNNTEIAKQRFNQTGGVHIVQRMYGCEWDDETGEVNGFMQWGYDGEDFLAFDLKTETWVAPIRQAFTTKVKLDNDKATTAQTKHFLTQECIKWLKKYLEYGKTSLQRTELPSVSLLQKTPSSPVSCHATGFHPNRAMMFWRKDGEKLHEDVDHGGTLPNHGGTLPNHDGTFQMSVDLDLSSVTPEDWGRYDCVFRLSGVKDDIITKLEKEKIETNAEEPIDTTVIIIAAVVVLVVIAAVGFFIYKKKMNVTRPPPREIPLENMNLPRVPPARPLTGISDMNLPLVPPARPVTDTASLSSDISSVASQESDTSLLRA